MDSTAYPTRGVDYPETFEAFERWLSDEEACRQYLAGIRWRSGFGCPICGEVSVPWVTGGGLYKCRRCKARSSVTAGTVLQDSRKSLRTWLLVMWFVTGQKYGASAIGLQRQLGFGSYQTAWAWLHKLRRAMVRPERDQLSGDVEVDETFVGGVEPGAGGRHVGKKSLVAIAAEVRGRGIGRIRLQRVTDSSADSVMPFVTESIARGSTVVTDGLLSYDGLTSLGFGHRKLIVRGSKKTADKLLPRVHIVASLLKRWLLGTHQGAVSRRHLDYYLDEFTFRFNRRGSKARGLLFFRLLECALSTPAHSYRILVGGKAKKG